MAIRVISSNATNVSAWNAAVSGDTMQYTFAGPYTSAIDYGAKWAGKNLTLQNLAGSNIALPVTPIGGINPGNGSTIGSDNGYGFRFYNASGTGGAVFYATHTGYATKTVTAYDTVFDGAATNAAGFVVGAYTWNIVLNTKRCTFTGYNSLNAGLMYSRAGGSTGVANVTADYCDFSGGTPIYSSDAAGVLTVTRSTIRNGTDGANLYVMSQASFRFNRFYNITNWAIDPGGTSVVNLSVYRNTFDNAGAGNLRGTARAGSTLNVRGNWFRTMIVPLAYTTWTNNGYFTLVSGTPGTGDFATLSDPGFVNQAGRDYRLLDSSSLIGKGWDTGDLTDAAGLPAVVNGAADAGAYENQTLLGGAGVALGISF